MRRPSGETCGVPDPAPPKNAFDPALIVDPRGIVNDIGAAAPPPGADGAWLKANAAATSAIAALAAATANGHLGVFAGIAVAAGMSSSQSSSRRTSRIDWNRSSGFFSKQAATTRLMAGERR